MPRLKIQLPDHTVFSTELTVRVGDVNFGGHLGNDSVLSLVHEARMRYLASIGYSELDVEGLFVLMTDATIAYHSEAFFGDRLLVELGLGDLFRAGCVVYFRISNIETGREVARASTGIAFTDRETRKLRQVPDAFLQKTGLG